MRQRQGGTATRQWSIMLVLLPLCLMPGVLVGQEAARHPAGTPALPAPFVLTIQERVLSLGAQDASLQAIIEAIGRQMHIDVAVHPPVEEHLTLAFERLSLAEAIEQFRRYANIVYRTTPAQGDIVQIIVFRLGAREALGATENDPSDAASFQPKPFQFRL